MEQRNVKAYEEFFYRMSGLGAKAFVRKLMRDADAGELYQKLTAGTLVRELEERQRGKLPENDGRKLQAMQTYAAEHDVEREYDELYRRGIRFVTERDEEYPEKLRRLPDAPYALYYVGKLPDAGKRSVAVIGARNCTEYGRRMAEIFGEQLAKNQIEVISGMARGIDGISQCRALEQGGYSFGVLGCGVDVCYPESNRELYEALIQQGGICSEYPPGTMPRPELFPIRNRIISGLADAVVVVEAREKSGTLITVDMALEQGKEVYALPGRADDPLSRGCNRLIQQGAGLVTSPQELLEELVEETDRAEGAETAQYIQQQLFFPEGEQKRLYELLEWDVQSAEKLLFRYQESYHSRISLPELLRGMLELCAQGAARQTGGMYFARQR